MALQDITAKIKVDAEAAADRIIGAAEAAAGKTVAAAEAHANALREKARARGERAAAAARQRQEISANLDARKALLATRQEGIAKAITQAQAEIAKLPAAKYSEWIEKLLVHYAEGDEQVVIAHGDKKRITAAVLKRANAALKKAGKPGNLSFAKETGDFSGGVVLNIAGAGVGSISNSLTVAALFKARREELELAAAAALFGGGA